MIHKNPVPERGPGFLYFFTNIFASIIPCTYICIVTLTLTIKTMKIIFNSKTTILQVEAFIRTLRPEEGRGMYHMFQTFPDSLETEGLTLSHWDEDEDGFLFNGYAHQIKGGGWALYAGSGIQRTIFAPQGKGTLVTYEGPFNGMGESPYTPTLDLKEVLKGRVSASGYEGSVKGYLDHRAKSLVKWEMDQWENVRIGGAGLPRLFSEKGWSLWVHQEKGPVEGFENMSPEWAGSPIKVEFLPSRPKSERAWDSKDFFRLGGLEEMPAWVVIQ